MYSIIVPIYKVEQFLSKCIDSILVQTHTDFELILVDDGSPDNCPIICDNYVQKDPRVKVIHKKNGGLISARKAGLNLAKGEYICYVDGDDFVNSDMLESYEKILTKNKVDMICTGYSMYYNDNRIISMSQKILSGFYNKNDLFYNIYPKMLSTFPFYSFYIQPSIWSKCLKKSIAEKVYEDIPDNISLGEDVAATYVALLLSSSISVIEYCGYMYRQNHNSMTHTYDMDLYKKIINLINYLKKIQINTGWQAGNQIDEYALYLLFLAKNNEFKYNQFDGYFNKKKNMKKYLNNPIFKELLKCIKIEGFKNKLVLWCFKSHFLLPLYIYETFLSKGMNNE